MVQNEQDPERENRIIYEIVVDCYDEYEQMMGWYYYLESNLHCPFKAKCIIERNMSPLELNEVVKVIGIADEDDCKAEMFVIIEFKKRELGVPLMQLQPINADEKTIESIEDWQYWINKGYTF